jgi:hypothetical protein
MNESPEDNGVCLVIGRRSLTRFLIESKADRDAKGCECGVCGFIISSTLSQDMHPIINLVENMVAIHPTTCFSVKGVRKSLVSALFCAGKGSKLPIRDILEEETVDEVWVIEYATNFQKRNSSQSISSHDTN